jgi:hypothetical protein
VPAALDTAPRKIRVKAHTRKAPTPRVSRPSAAQVARNTAAARQGYVSQGRAVAAQAYRAAPVSVRRAAVRQAKSDQRHPRTSAAAGRRATTGAVLAVHGRRAFDQSPQGRRLISGRQQELEHVTETPSINRTIVDKSKPFKGFEKYQSRALKGNLKAQDRQTAQAILSQPGKLDFFERLTKGGLDRTRTSTLFAMNQLQRPSAAIGAGLAGKSVSHGFLHPENGTRDWETAVRKTGIKNKYAVGGLAFLGSVAADPTTYLSFGTGSVARHGAMRVYEQSLREGLDHAAAGQAARAFYEAAPAAAKHAGPTIGMRGMPVRAATRGSRRAVYSKPLTLGRVKEAAKRAGIETKPVVGPALRAQAHKLSANVRPPEWDPISWEIARRGAQVGRGGEREAWRHAESRASAYNKLTKKFTDEQHIKVAHAAEDTPHLATLPEVVAVAKAHGLSKDEQTVLENIVTERRLQHAQEPGRPEILQESRVGAQRAPVRPTFAPEREAQGGKHLAAAGLVANAFLKRAPERTVDLGPEITADMVKSSRARMRNQASKVETALRQVGEEKGRRAMTNMRVPGQAGVPSLGQTNAAERLANEQRHLKAVIEGHRGLRAERSMQQAALRRYERERAQFEQLPKGYLHRQLSPAERDKMLSSPMTGQGKLAQRVGGPSYKGRRDPRALANMSPEELARYEHRIPVLMAERALEHRRSITMSKVNEYIAGLGKNLDEKALANIKHGDEHRLYSRDERGFKALFDETGKVDRAKLDNAIRAGHDVVEVDPRVTDFVRHWARGQRSPRTSDLSRLVPLGTHLEDAQVNLPTMGALRGTTRALKWWQTAPNPGYHVRNLVGDTFNAALAGTTVGDMRKAFTLRRVESALKKLDHHLEGTKGWDDAKAALARMDKKIENYGANGKLSDRDVVMLAVKHGVIRTGLSGNELRLARMGKDVGVLSARQRAMEGIQTVGDWREDYMRLATFRGALKRGMDPDTAAAHSLAHHFDYSNLTETEQKARDFIPFWTFMARNTPLQVKSLAKAPGVYATVEKARRESLSMSGVDPNSAQALREFEQQNLPWGTGQTMKNHGLRIPVTAAPMLPYTDLSRIPFPQGGKSATAKNWGLNQISSINNLVRSPFELVSGFNTFTGQMQGQSGSYVAAPAPFKVLPPEVQKALGMRMIRDKRTGLREMGIPWQVVSATRMAPGPNLAMRAGVPQSVGNAQPFGLAAASYLAGPRIVGQDPRAVRMNLLLDRVQQLTKIRNDLEQRVQGHKRGEDWGGKIGKLNKVIKKHNNEIADLSKALGAKSPIGVPRAKGRRHKSQGLPGGNFGGSFGGGFAPGGFGG